MTWVDHPWVPLFVLLVSAFMAGATISIGLSIIRSLVHIGIGDGDPSSSDD